MRVLSHVAILATFAAGTAFADDWSKTFSIAGQPELHVETDDGSVTVRPWDERKISARVITLGWKIGAGDVEIRESQAGDRVDLVVKVPRNRHFGFNFGNRWIKVELQVPRQLRSDVRTGDGSITIQGVEGETRLHTGDGRIEASSLGGSLKAESGDGHIRVRGRLDSLTLHTGDGSVEADVLPGSKMTAGWRVETGDGSVTIRLPRDFAADLDAHTGDGHISYELPGVSGRHDKDLRARVGGGGAAFSVRTGDGSIHIGLL